MRENSKKTTHLFSVSLPSQLSKKTKQQLRPRRRPGRRRPRRPAPGAQDGQARRGEDEEGLRRAAVQVAGGTADRDEVKKKRVFFFFAYLLISQVTIYIYILFFTINRMEKERGKRKGGGREGCCWRRERKIFFFQDIEENWMRNKIKEAIYINAGNPAEMVGSKKKKNLNLEKGYN